MEVKIKNIDEEKIEFKISDTNPAFVNSLRRAILKKVPVLAIDEVEFMVNDTVMGDEVIAHRLGQMPLKTPEGYLLPTECDCREGRCPNCSVDLNLDAEGPGMVRASDLDPSDPEVTPVQEETPIARLGEDQRIKLTAIGRLGFGGEHANWQAAVASYKYMPVITIDQEARDDWSKAVEACPVDILEVEDGDLVVTDREKCNLCNACADAYPEAIKVEGSPNEFIFTVESTGAIPPERIVNEAIGIMKNKCHEFTEKLEQLKEWGEL